MMAVVAIYMFQIFFDMIRNIINLKLCLYIPAYVSAEINQSKNILN